MPIEKSVLSVQPRMTVWSLATITRCSRSHRPSRLWSVETISPSTTRLKTNPHVEKASNTNLCLVGAVGGKPVCVPGSKKMPHASHRA